MRGCYPRAPQSHVSHVRALNAAPALTGLIARYAETAQAMMSSDDDYHQLLWVIPLVLALGVGYLVLLASASNDCEKRHGKLVQGVGWYECVAAPPEPPHPSP